MTSPRPQRAWILVLLLAIVVLSMGVVGSFSIPFIRCGACGPLYEAILGPGQPPESWRIECPQCNERRRITLVRHKFGGSRDLTNPWLVHLKWGVGAITTPRVFQIGPHTDEDNRRALPVLIAALRARDPGTEYRAGYLIGHMGDSAVEAVPFLVAALRDRSLPKRSSAAGALGVFKSRTTESIPALIEALQESRWSEALLPLRSMEALGAIGPAARAAIPVIHPLLGHPDAAVRQYAARTLGELGPDARVAIPELTALLRSSDYYTADIARETLKKLGVPSK